jgi:death-on-curing family protein
MVIRINETIVNIVHNYVVRRLIALEGIVYSGTISGPLERIFSGSFGRHAYFGVCDRAGAILYSIVHGHSFNDGNKRTGLLTTYLFLMFNGYALHVPKDTTPFLEKMADASNPSAPTEKDAIEWVKRNSKKEFLPAFTNVLLIVYCKLWGTGFIENMATIILEQNALPYMDKDNLIDKNLKKPKEPSICVNS